MKRTFGWGNGMIEDGGLILLLKIIAKGEQRHGMNEVNYSYFRWGNPSTNPNMM